MQARQLLALLGGCLLVLGGCARQTEPESSVVEQAPEKVKVTAYIQVSSGCQAETVDLLNQLAKDNEDIVELDLVDFGTTEGMKRWKADGLDCMAILFNESPALKFPDKAGEDKAVVFKMPVPFRWTHEDLELAFKAIRDGTLEILTEEEAQREFGPQLIDVEVSVRDVEGGAELLIGESPVFTLRAEADGKTPTERAEGAKAGIEEWTQEPLQPGEADVVAEGDDVSIVAKGIQIVRITEADVEAAGAENVEGLAKKWVRSIRIGVIDAARAAASEE